MLLHSVRIKIQNIGIRKVALLVVAGILSHQPLDASDSWPSIMGLKSGAQMVVDVSDGRLAGSMMQADEAGLTIRVAARGKVTVARDLVLQVSVIRTRHRSRWYSIPLTVVAAAGGVAAGYGISSLMTCEENSSPCKKGKGAIMGLFAGGAAVLTYKATSRPSEELEVIYRKTSTKTDPAK